MPRTRREAEATYHGSVAFDCVNGINVAIVAAKVEVGPDRIELTWAPVEGMLKAGHYAFTPVFLRRGILSVFAADGTPVFETKAIPYMNCRGWGLMYRIQPDGQGWLVEDMRE